MDWKEIIEFKNWMEKDEIKELISVRDIDNFNFIKRYKYKFFSKFMEYKNGFMIKKLALLCIKEEDKLTNKKSNELIEKYEYQVKLYSEFLEL